MKKKRQVEAEVISRPTVYGCECGACGAEWYISREPRFVTSCHACGVSFKAKPQKRAPVLQIVKGSR